MFYRTHTHTHTHTHFAYGLQLDGMCTYLGVAEEEDPYVREVAQMALSAPLPDGWEEVEDDNGNVTFE